MSTNEKRPGGRGTSSGRGRKYPQGTKNRKNQTKSTKTPPRNKEEKSTSAAEVVFTPAIPFSRQRFLLRLLTVAAVVLALVFCLSIFFKVDTIVVSGTNKYTAWDIREASGIETGDNLLTFSQARACGRIRSYLPYVKSVRIGIKLPGTVLIDIVEEDIVYAVKSQDDSWWLMTAEGRLVEQADQAAAGNCTKILGVQLHAPAVNQNAVAYESAGNETVTDPDGATESTVPVTVTGAQRLAAARQVLQQLEANGIIGLVASVDVTNISAINLWYGKQYQVELGNTEQMDYKIAAMKMAIHQMSAFQTGILDISKGKDQDGVIFEPFS